MPLELGLSETVQHQVAGRGPELTKHLSTSSTDIKHRSSSTVALIGHSPLLLGNLLMFQNWWCCIQRHGIWSRKSTRTEIIFGSQILGKSGVERREKWEEKEEDIEGFRAIKGSASGYSLFWPGCLLVLIFSGLCSRCKSFGCLRWVERRQPVNGRAAAQVQADRWRGCSSTLSSLYFPPILFFPPPHPILLSGGGRATWTSMCLKSKLNSPSNYFLSLCTSNLSSPQTDGNCCCTAGLAPAKLADERQAGVMLVWLISCKEIKEENPAHRLRRVWFGSCSSRMAGSLITEKSSIYLSI